jgi:prepilin-type N-terminal cleavage/methylation domain-containing protein
MKTRHAGLGGFTLAELMVVIFIIGVLMALLLPAILKGTTAAKIAEAKAKINSISMAIDAFQTDFGFYPRTDSAFNPTTGTFDGAGAPYGNFAYSEALVQCLCNKFTKGVGDPTVTVTIDTVDFEAYQGTSRVIGGAPVTAGPYLQLKPSDLADKDDDGFPELVDPWRNAFIYVPKDDYFQADGTTYNAGAGTWNDADADGVLVNADRSLDPGEFGEHFQRFRFQLISLGPDGWTPGLYRQIADPLYQYWNITAKKKPPVNPVPCLVGTDTVLVAPVAPGKADDINNWQ